MAKTAHPLHKQTEQSSVQPARPLRFIKLVEVKGMALYFLSTNPMEGGPA